MTIFDQIISNAKIILVFRLDYIVLVSGKDYEKIIDMQVISITKADYLGEYRINFLFSDGVEKLIDFSSFLNTARNPMTRKYLDKRLFENFSIRFGDIIWNEYEMCFPIWDLHEGKL